MNTLKKLALILSLTFGLALAGCSQQGAQSSLEPKTTTCSPTNVTLQWAVGTANIAGTATGLNTMVTLRQNAGGSCTAGASVLDNAPTITGPAGFAVPATADAGTDGGTNKISGNLVTNLLAPPALTTFDNAASGQGYGLASGYGFLPAVQTTSLGTPSFSPYMLPFYSGTQMQYIGGPPAFVPPADGGGTHTSTRDGTFPNGYLGYVLGFVDFAAAPVAGSYGLSVVIPTGISTSSGASGTATVSGSASITHAAPLAAWAAGPTFVSNGTGGGTITTNFAGGAGLTEEYIELVDNGPDGGNDTSSACTTSPLSVSYPIYYTFKVTPGAATVTVPNNIGPAQPGKTQGHTLCTAADNAGTATPNGDMVTTYGFAVDYSLFSTAYPQSNGNPAPTFTLNAGQADVTTSPSVAAQTE